MLALVGDGCRRRGSNVNLFDLVIVGATAVAGFGGYRLGFLTRGLSWAGLGVGIFVAAQLAPNILELISGPEPEVRLAIVAVIFLGVASLGGALGETLGARLRRSLPQGPAREADHAIGALAGVLGSVVLVWLLLPALSEVPGTISSQVRDSKIAQALDDAAPRAPKPLQALRQLVRDTNFPEVFSDLRRAPTTGAPPGDLAMSASVRNRVVASTVKVSGAACGRVQEGSGFAAAAETIVTNAHVVAGVDRPSVLRPDGRRLSAQVVSFDAARDLAVLRVDGLGQSALPIGSAEVGTSGAVFGHPGGQVPVEASPARIEDRVTARGRDLYNRSVIRRQVFILAAELAPGDSGGALVDPQGTVVGVAFAVAPDRRATAYALTEAELSPVLEARGTRTVDTGPCLR